MALLCPRHLTVLAAALLVAATASATSIVPPENLGELAHASDAVVLALAGGSSVTSAGPLLFTLTNFRVNEGVSGGLGQNDRITVRVPGGELGGWTWAVPGSPHFQPGHVYLLFLHANGTGQWQPQAASYGLLERITGRDGTSLLTPLPEMADVETFPRPDGVLPEKVETYQEALVVPQLRAVAAGRAIWSAAGVLARSNQLPLVASIQGTPPDGCTYITPSTPYPRWPYNTPNSPGQVELYYSPSGGDTSTACAAASGCIPQLQGAVGMWMGIPSVSLNLAYAGLKSNYLFSCSACTTSDGKPVPCNTDFPNQGIVVFNDPCNEVPPGNELAFGGPWYGPEHTFDGTTWYSIISQFVVVSATASSSARSLTGYQEMLAHELGHGLGYGHFTSDPYSVMYPYCCNAIDSTDRTCTQYTYPSVVATPTPTPTRTPTRTPTSGPTPTPAWTPTPGPTPTPTWTPTIGPTPTPTPTRTPTTPPDPPVPTGVSASDGTFPDRVRVTWNASLGAAGYWVYRNTFNSPPAKEIAFTSATSFDDLTAGPGQLYWYWLRAIASSGSTSTYSLPDTGFASTAPTPTPTAPQPTPTPTAPVTPTPSVLTASFAVSSAAPYAGSAVQFTDTSAGVPRSWQWTFGDGASSTDRNPSHAYARRGAYAVTLRVGNGTTTSQAVRTITVGARARRLLPRR
jgi:PKD repeat protein